MSYIKDMKVLKMIFTFILPPAAAYMQVGPTSKYFLINILLTCIAWFPGIIHAIWLITTNKEG